MQTGKSQGYGLCSWHVLSRCHHLCGDDNRFRKWNIALRFVVANQLFVFGLLNFVKIAKFAKIRYIYETVSMNQLKTEITVH